LTSWMKGTLSFRPAGGFMYSWLSRSKNFCHSDGCVAEAVVTAGEAVYYNPTTGVLGHSGAFFKNTPIRPAYDRGRSKHLDQGQQPEASCDGARGGFVPLINPATHTRGADVRPDFKLLAWFCPEAGPHPITDACFT